MGWQRAARFCTRLWLVALAALVTFDGVICLGFDQGGWRGLYTDLWLIVPAALFLYAVGAGLFWAAKALRE